MQPTTPFRIGVESTLPGQDDWFATIYGCWFGKYFSEASLGMALQEVGAQFTLFYDSLAPLKPNACQRITEMCQRLQLPFLFNNTYGDIYGPWLPGTGRASYNAAQPEQAIRECVRAGARCLALPHLLPEVAGSLEPEGALHIAEGAGEYLFTYDMNSAAAREFMQPHLGAADEVHYRFGGCDITLKPSEGDERRLNVRLQQPVEPS